MLVVAAAAVAVHLSVGRDSGVLSAPDAVTDVLAERPTTFALVILGTLSRIALFPFRLRLIYDLSESGPWTYVAYALGAVTAAAGLVGGWLLVRRRSLVAFGVLSFVLFCLPFLQLVRFSTWSLVSERFLFMPVLGLAIVLGGALRGLPERLVGQVAALLFLTYLVVVTGRAVAWASSEDLLVENYAYSPQHVLVVEAYVDRLLEERDHERARTAVAAVRDDGVRAVLESYVAAHTAAERGDTATVRRLLPGIATRIFWDSDVLKTKVANLALEAGEPWRAAEVYRGVLSTAGHDVGARYNLAIALKAMGNKEEALTQFRRALDDGLRSAEAWNHSALLYRDLGRLEAAERAFLSALDADVAHWRAAYNLARLYLGSRRLEDARRRSVRGDCPRERGEPRRCSRTLRASERRPRSIPVAQPEEARGPEPRRTRRRHGRRRRRKAEPTSTR
jgi:hypothetical protein